MQFNRGSLLVLGLIALFCFGKPQTTSAGISQVCTEGFPEQPVLSQHISHTDIVRGVFGFDEILAAGEERFAAQYNICDGQGRPATTGGGDKRLADAQPEFIRTSAPDANSCAGCHNLPRVGGAGEFVANVFVLAQVEDPVVVHVLAHPVSIDESGALTEPPPEGGMIGSNERNTLGMFGSGAIEMLAREMTTELRAQVAGLSDGPHILTTKGVDFEVVVSGGEVVEAKGIDTDLIVKPFHQSGVVVSLREFTNNAFNHHHGMQSEERFDLNPDKGVDYDEDGVANELSVGDITATTLWQASLGVPGRLLPADPQLVKGIQNGEQLFERIECSSCHLPEMELSSREFVEPNPFNPSGNFRDTKQSYSFDMTTQGQGPFLEQTAQGGALVRAYTDLKRHNLCDAPTEPDPIRFFCNEQRAQGRPTQDGRAGAEFFLTRKLWDVGNSGPYGHRGDLTTITEAILMHGGEARTSRDAFVALAGADKADILSFLKSLTVLPAGSNRVVTMQ